MVAESAPEHEHSRVIVFCERHTLLAALNTGVWRLSDVINDPLHKNFRLEQVKINRADRMNENVAEYGEVVIRRDSIQALMVMSEPVRPAQQRIANFVPKQVVKVAALLPSFHIVGSLYLSAKDDPAEFLLEGEGTFAVLRDASMTMTARTDKQIQVPTAFLNRAFIELATAL